MQEKILATAPLNGEAVVSKPEEHSGVMWGAIFAGALAMITVMLLMFSLAGAFGFAALSPWGNNTPAVGKAFAISAALVLIVIQWVSAAFGGYLTGRMRTGYIGAHTHEVFFRDTAHGFLTWALATVVGVLLLASTVMHAHGPHGSGDHGQHDMSMMPQHYIERLFVTADHDVIPTEQDKEEAGYVLSLATTGGDISEEDRTSLIQLVASRTHMSEADAEHRVDNVIAQEKNAVESARKYAAASSLFVFFSMMIGAFIASVAGGLGGQHRDLHYVSGSLDER